MFKNKETNYIKNVKLNEKGNWVIDTVGIPKPPLLLMVSGRKIIKIDNDFQWDTKKLRKVTRFLYFIEGIKLKFRLLMEKLHG